MSVLTDKPVTACPDAASSCSSLSSTRRHRLRSAMSRIFSRHGANHASTVPAPHKPVSADLADPAADANRASQINSLFETWEDWVGVYQQGSINLSSIARPVCFGGFGYMPPPAHFSEKAREQEVSKASALDWSAQKGWIEKELVRVLQRFRLKTASVSLVDETCQRVCASVNLPEDLFVICRNVSIDAHTILSKEYLALLDASEDWRSKLNPLVLGPPFVKFYLGVPVILNGFPIACVAVFDPYTRTSLSEDLLHAVQSLAEKISARISGKISGSQHQRGSRTTFDTRPQSRAAESDFELFYDVSSVSQAGSTDTCSTNTLDHHPCEFALSKPENSLSLVLKTYSLPPKPRSFQQLQVIESLTKCRSLPHAVKKACQIVCRNLGATMVYVTEIRVGRNKDSRARLVGYYLKHKDESPAKVLRARTEEKMLKDSKLLHAAVESQFGVQYISSVQEQVNELENERSGILVPFRRSTEKQPGAFVLAAFVNKYREFLPGDVEFTKKVIKALENVISVYEPQAG